MPLHCELRNPGLKPPRPSKELKGLHDCWCSKLPHRQLNNLTAEADLF